MARIKKKKLQVRASHRSVIRGKFILYSPVAFLRCCVLEIVVVQFLVFLLVGHHHHLQLFPILKNGASKQKKKKERIGC